MATNSSALVRVVALVAATLLSAACDAAPDAATPSGHGDAVATVPPAYDSAMAAMAAVLDGSLALPADGTDPGGAFTVVDSREIGPYVVRTWTAATTEWRQPGWPVYDVVTVSTAGSVIAQTPNGLVGGETGTDVNGNGSPDIVIHTLSGGNACCQATTVLDTALNPPTVLSTEGDAYCTADLHGTFQDLDGDGSKEYVTCTAAPWDIEACFTYWKMSGRPAVALQYDPTQAAYVPASSTFATYLAAGLDPAREAIAAATPGGPDDCLALNLAFTYLYLGRTEEAWSTLRLYTGARAPQLQAAIEAAVAKDPLYVAPDQAGRPVLGGATPGPVTVTPITATTLPPLTATAAPLPATMPPADTVAPTVALAPGQVELIASGPTGCGGLAPIGGCAFDVVEWVAGEPMTTVGDVIKLVQWHPDVTEDDLTGNADVPRCTTPSIAPQAMDQSNPLPRVRIRGTPCKWKPDYLLCMCGPEAFAVPDAAAP